MSTPSPHPIAVFSSVYHRSRLAQVKAAFESVFAADPDLTLNLYVAVDGPIAPDLDRWLKQYPNLHHLTRLPENRGLGAALNQLIDELGDEDLICRMDTDDLCLPGRFTRQLAHMQTTPECAILGGALELRDETDRVFATRRYPDHPALTKHIQSGRSPLAHTAVCIRRAVFEAGLRYPPLRYCEDIDLWLRAYAAGFRLDNLPEPLVSSRVAANLKTRYSLAYAKDKWRAWWPHRHLWRYGRNARLFELLAHFVLPLLPKRLLWPVHRWWLKRR